MIRNSDIVLIVIAVIFPPAAVFIVTGLSVDLIINVVLTILGFTPGHLHAFWLLYKKMEAEEKNGYGRGVFYPYGPNGPWYETRGPLTSLSDNTTDPGDKKLPDVPVLQNPSSGGKWTWSGSK